MNSTLLLLIGVGLIAAILAGLTIDGWGGNTYTLTGGDNANQPCAPVCSASDASAAVPPAEMHWEVGHHSGTSAQDSGVYFDCTGIRFSVKLAPGDATYRHQIHLHRPDGTVFQRLVITPEGGGHAQAKIEGEHVLSMLSTPGTWLVLLMDPLSGKSIVRRTLDVVDLATAVGFWRPALAIEAEEGGGTIDIISIDSTALRLQVSLNPGGQVPLGRYCGLELTLSGMREGERTPVEILRWPLTSDAARWKFTLAYPVAALEMGDWRFELRFGTSVLANVPLAIITPEEVAAKARVRKIRVKVPGKRRSLVFLKGRRIDRAKHASIQPAISLELPCVLPSYQVGLQLVVCVDGEPLLSCRDTVVATRTSLELTFGALPLPELTQEGREHIYSFALFVEGRYCGSGEYALFRPRIRVADAEGRLTAEIPENSIDFATEAEGIRQNLGAA